MLVLPPAINFDSSGFKYKLISRLIPLLLSLNELSPYSNKAPINNLVAITEEGLSLLILKYNLFTAENLK